jgi:predicted acetyltransferase
MQLLWPAAEHLGSYADALRRGWSPDTTRPEAALEELAQIEEDPALFLARQVDREAQGPPVVLPDGSRVPRLPGYRRWMWDGEFCGAINFRWQPGTSLLPPTCLGHIGFSVVPWKRRRGHATRALRLLLDGIDEEGLTCVELDTDESNLASRRVIEANGGVLVARSSRPAAYGGTGGLRYRIDLPPRAPVCEAAG